MFFSAEAGPAASGSSAVKKEEAMDVDGEEAAASAKGGEDYSEVMNDPAFLQSVLENLPGVDPQSEAVRTAMGAITGQKKEEDDANKKKKDDEKK